MAIRRKRIWCIVEILNFGFIDQGLHELARLLVDQSCVLSLIRGNDPQNEEKDDKEEDPRI
jgi:hypothetical protein